MTQGRTRTRAIVSAVAASALTALAAANGGAAEPTAALAAPKNAAAPTISGSRTVGSTLTANPGRWTGTQPITFTYEWARCNSRLAECSGVIARTRRYVLVQADQGRRMF